LLSASSNSSKNENGYMLWEDYSYVRLTQVGRIAYAPIKCAYTLHNHRHTIHTNIRKYTHTIFI